MKTEKIHQKITMPAQKRYFSEVPQEYPLLYFPFYDKLIVEFNVKFMTVASVLTKEKIISLSELQKNPGKALDADIVRIVKNGKEIGIFMSKDEFEDFVEEHLELKPEVKRELDKAILEIKEGKVVPLKNLM